MPQAPKLQPASKKKIRSLIFDLFGVVIAFDELSVYRRLAKHCRDSDAAFASMQGLVSTPELITGKLTLQQLHQQLVDSYGLALGYETFRDRWLTPYTVAMPGVADILRELSGKHRLVLLSNVDRYYLEIVRDQHRELDHFVVQLVSCEIGVAKPADAAFVAALHACGAEPSECYFVDDKAENIDAASKLGIRGHVFTTAQALRASLIEMGILSENGGHAACLAHHAGRQ